MNDIDAIIHLSLEGAEDVSKVREFILSLALKGKLVNQDPNDESADALLSRLRTDKSRSSEPGKRTSVAPPDLKPLSESHHPYPLPIGWCWVKLSSVGYINPRSSLQDDTQVGFVPMSLIKEGYTNKHGFERKKWVEIKKNYTHFQDGDVGVAKITPCFENRKSCVFKNLPNGSGAGSTELYIFRNSHGIFDPDYLLMLFKTNLFISNGKARMTGTAGQQRIPKDYFSDNPIPLPPLSEQKRIAQKVKQFMQLCDGLDSKCMFRSEKLHLAHAASIKRLIETENAGDLASAWKFIYNHFNTFYSSMENVVELKKAILILAMQGKLIQSTHYTNSKWDKGKLGDFLEFEYGKSLPSTKRSNTGEFPVFGSNGMVGTHNEALINEPCIIIGRKGSAGAVTLYKHEGCFVTDVAFYCIPNASINLEFAYHLLCSLDLPTLSKGVKPGINRNEAYGLSVMIPPLEEQLLIVSYLEQFFILINTLQSKLICYERTRRRLLDILLKDILTP